MAGTLEKLLIFPPFPPPAVPLSDAKYDEGIKQQINALKKLQDKALVAKTSGEESALDVVDPALHSAAYAFVLLAYVNIMKKEPTSTGLEWPTLLEKAANFLCVFDGRQMRYLGKELDQVIDILVNLARNSRQSFLAVAPIGQAILQLDPVGSTFTFRHQLLVELALESGDYGSAIPVLEKSVLYFPTTTNQVKYKFLCESSVPAATYITLGKKLVYQDLLNYFFYGAMVFIGLRRWEEAADLLECAICYPTKEAAVSKILVEVYKKWVLCGVLAHGKFNPIPRSLSNAVQKSLHTLGKPYETLAEIFVSGTASRLKNEADFGAKMWQDDRNQGLVIALLAAYQKNQIRNLANVYSQLTIPEVCSMTTSAETGGKTQSHATVTAVVKSMIDTGELQASLNQPSTGHAVLTFSATGDPVLSETEIQRELTNSVVRIQALDSEVKITDKILTHDKEYAKWASKQRKNAKNADQGIAGSDMEWEIGGDEELMTGVSF